MATGEASEMKELERKALEEVSAQELWRHTETAAQGVRLSGSPEEAQAFDYIGKTLKGFGAEVQTYRFESLIGYPGEANLQILSPQVKSLECITQAFSPSTPPEGIEGELVDVGAGNPADYAGREVKGKVVLINGFGLAAPAKALTAESKGSIAQVFVHDDQLHEMIISTVWGTPTPETAPFLPHSPIVALRWQDGVYLRELLRSQSVRLRIKVQSWTGWKEIPVLTAQIEGAIEPEKFVLLSGHVDSWHYGAMDNASANATALEVARILSQHRAKLRRSLRLAFWSGHSHGRYSGSAWYADNFWEDLHKNCVAHVNVDSTGAKGATVLSEARTMAETRAFSAEVIKELTQQQLKGVRFGRMGDQSFLGCGVPSLFMSLSEQPLQETGEGGRPFGGLKLGWWWHTPEDTLDKLDIDNLVRDARVYVLTLLRLCASPLLPFDYRSVAEELHEALDQLQQAGKSALDLGSCLEKAEELRSEAVAFSEAIDSLGDEGKGKPRQEGALEVVNETLMALGRILVPIGYTKVGAFDHDLTVPLGPIPVLQRVAELASLEPKSNEFRFLHTRLVREANKVGHALDSAADRIRETRRQLAPG